MAPDIVLRLESQFEGESLATALELVTSLTLGDRVRRAVVHLGHGDLDRLRQCVTAANVDCRDVLWWAEYDHPDAPETRLRSMSDPFPHPE